MPPSCGEYAHAIFRRRRLLHSTAASAAAFYQLPKNTGCYMPTNHIFGINLSLNWIKQHQFTTSLHIKQSLADQRNKERHNCCNLSNVKCQNEM